MPGHVWSQQTNIFSEDQEMGGKTSIFGTLSGDENFRNGEPPIESVPTQSVA
jgi:hypothetical protein